MITLSWWAFLMIMSLSVGIACWYGVYVGHRHGYHQGYWTAFVKEHKK